MDNNKRSGWHWQAGDYWSTRVTGMQVIDNPNERPRQFPVGFSPPGSTSELPSAPKPAFAPQIMARRRV